MMYKILTTSLVLAFAPLALAQDYPVGAPGTTSASASASASATASASTSTTTHTIQVGPNGTLTYSPNNITASVGDTIAFLFNPKNHTVTQSTFANPCSLSSDGIDSGFTHPITTSQNTSDFSFVVNATTPLWFYCAQKNPASHCAKGMVFAINAPKTGNNTFANFQAAALNSNSTNSTSSNSSSSTNTSSSTNSSSTSTPNGNGAIASSVNLGLTALLVVMGVFITL